MASLATTIIDRDKPPPPAGSIELRLTAEFQQHALFDRSLARAVADVSLQCRGARP